MPDSTGSYLGDVTDALGRGWNRFWFTPADPLPCCVLRIMVGLLAAAHFACLGTDLARWYGRDGLLPPGAVSALLTAAGEQANYHYSYLDYIPSFSELRIVHAGALIVAIAFAAGLFTRFSGVLTLVNVLAYVHRVPQVAGHLEPVLVFLLAYLCLAPSGACLSLDALLRRPSKRSHPLAPAFDPLQPSVAANIAIRLIQVHLAMFYAMMGLTKLAGEAWWDGEAMWLLLAQTQSRPLDLTALGRAGQFGGYFINFWTHAIQYFELAFPVLIWNRLARPLLLALGIVVWASLILASGLLVFGLTMLVASAAFLPVECFQALAGGRSTAPAALLAAPTR